MTEGFLVLSLLIQIIASLFFVCIAVRIWIEVKMLNHKEIKFKVVNVKNDLHSNEQKER